MSSRSTAAVLALASSSPRRSQLLTAAQIPFVLAEPGPEPQASGTPPELALARARSKACGAQQPPGLVLPLLGVDTVVDVGGREFGKPRDRGEAAAMLAALAGRRHRVHTAHCLFDARSGACYEELASAEVTCAVPAAEALTAYLDSGDWRGKAGAYGIQDATQSFLTMHSGSYDTVVGLHVEAVRRLLRQIGLA
jgi:septum formation protein